VCVVFCVTKIHPVPRPSSFVTRPFDRFNVHPEGWCLRTLKHDASICEHLRNFSICQGFVVQINNRCVVSPFSLGVEKHQLFYEIPTRQLTERRLHASLQAITHHRPQASEQASSGPPVVHQSKQKDKPSRLSHSTYCTLNIP